VSTEEQYLAIGTMTTQRTDARRQAAILRQEIKDTGDAMRIAGSFMTGEFKNLPEIDKASTLLRELGNRGGLQRLAEAIEEYRAFRVRDEELSASLREAGGE
jgi:hypothetical protein